MEELLSCYGFGKGSDLHMTDQLLTYLACPYTHSDPLVKQERFDLVTKLAGQLMNQGHIIFSPITHCHPIAEFCSLPGDWKYWEKTCRAYMRYSSEMIVYQLDGWDKSDGVKAEMEIAVEMGIPIYYCTKELLIYATTIWI